MGCKNVLVGVTGSVAAIKVPLLLESIQNAFQNKVHIKVIPTQRALHFFASTDASETYVLDSDEWETWKKIPDPVLHIELRKWADIIVIAPLSANTLAKLAHGICDNMLTCILRAWDLKKPVLICPAMNTHMWDHPFTARHLKVLEEELGYIIIPPIAKTLACGDVGTGAMAEVTTIAKKVKEVCDGISDGRPMSVGVIS